MMKELISSIRIRQWYKNALLFTGIVFSSNLLNTVLFTKAIFGFLIFCIASSTIYIFNDIIDQKRDKEHPEKKFRPIASGKLKINTAIFFFFCLLILTVTSSYLINSVFMVITLIFLGFSFLYTLLLKNIFIIDIATIGLNFVFRAIAGCAAIGVFVSNWLILCSFLLAILLAAGKRKTELKLLKRYREHRPVLKKYSEQKINIILDIMIILTIASYSLYCIERKELLLTLPFVLIALTRYYFVIKKTNTLNDSEIFLRDRIILFSIIGWIITVIISLYR